MKLRALIVDDEPPARNKIRKFLSNRQDVDIVGEAEDGVEAIEKVLELQPDLLFLDIQMPRADGFDVLREIYPQLKPMVVFTTAYDQYAIRAFEVEALDYLLKPFTSDRFGAALERALQRRAELPDLAAKVARLLESVRPAGSQPERLLVRNEGRVFFVKSSEIDWIEAQEKYVLLHTGGRSHIIRHSLASLEARLSPAFVRIHRCFLVNLDALQQLAPLTHGDYEAVLKSGVRLHVGRSYRESLLLAMGKETGD